MPGAIAVARDPISMETDILDDDAIGLQFAEALLAGQAQGVQSTGCATALAPTAHRRPFASGFSEAGVPVLK